MYVAKAVLDSVRQRHPVGSHLVDGQCRIGIVMHVSFLARVSYRPLNDDGSWGQRELCCDHGSLRVATDSEVAKAGAALSGIVRLHVGRGYVTLFDSADLPLLWPVTWVLNRTGPTGRYANGRIASRFVFMHRLLMNPSPGQVVDHINGDGLDNRRHNLRLATTSGNLANAGKWGKKAATSKYKGVSFARKNQWRVRMGVKGRRIEIGTFATEEEAARAYDVAALQHFGEFARLNFPESRPQCWAKELGLPLAEATAAGVVAELNRREPGVTP